MNKSDIQMFKTYVKNAKVYFEWGSGGSTCYVSQQPHIKKIYSVESDYNFVKKLEYLQNVEFIYCEMDSINHWGQPGKNARTTQKITYSDAILDKQNVDFVLIDGRFRVACALKCFNVISEDTYIAFDDFLHRSQYHIILDYYDIISNQKEGVMVILKKKNVPSPSSELISKYELIED
jgi:hypothetical protein